METISKTINRGKVYHIIRQVIPIFYNSIREKVLFNVCLAKFTNFNPMQRNTFYVAFA